jgi:ribosomal protein S18 acetylase RimI-like enzyme
VTDTADIEIRKLGSDDALQLRNLRLHALKDAPTAFTESYEEMSALDQQDYVKVVRDVNYFGAFSGGALVGIMGYFVRPHRKQWHQGVLFGVYVHPDQRGQGIARRMLDVLLEDARQRVEIMVLQVAVDNYSARHTYLKAGFQSYGIEPKALKVGNSYIDEEHMWLDLNKPGH